MAMEKRNVFERDRTPCLFKQGNKNFCDCEDCADCKHVNTKQADDTVDIRDIEKLARIHQ